MFPEVPWLLFPHLPAVLRVTPHALKFHLNFLHLLYEFFELCSHVLVSRGEDHIVLSQARYACLVSSITLMGTWRVYATFYCSVSWVLLFTMILDYILLENCIVSYLYLYFNMCVLEVEFESPPDIL